MKAFTVIFLILTITAYSLYFLGVEAIISVAELHGHLDFIMLMGLLAFILKITIRSLNITTPEAARALGEAKSDITSHVIDIQTTHILKDLERQYPAEKLESCCTGEKWILNYRSFQPHDSLIRFAFTTKSNEIDRRRKFNPRLHSIKGFATCSGCDDMRPFLIEYYYSKHGKPTLHRPKPAEYQ